MSTNTPPNTLPGLQPDIPLGYLDNPTNMDISKMITIPLWLRDTYGRVQQTPLYYFQGPLRENNDTEEAAKKASTQNMEESDIFLSGKDIFAYLNRNKNRNICNGVVTVVVHSLRDLYWNARSTLPIGDIKQLELALSRPLPTFKNIFEYKSLQTIGESIDIPLYQMFGTITPYSVLHIPVKDFIEMLNNKLPIRIRLDDTNIIIRLDYEQYDFWDPISKSLIEYIDISSC
jgi:hypothetical protein